MGDLTGGLLVVLVSSNFHRCDLCTGVVGISKKHELVHDQFGNSKRLEIRKGERTINLWLPPLWASMDT